MTVQARVCPPKLGPHIVSRLNLRALYTQACEAPVTLVSSSAGSGKTSLLAEWAGLGMLPVVWLNLETLDSDPARFVTGLIAAVQQLHPDFGASIHLLMRSNSPIPAEVLQAALIQAAAGLHTALVLVLDDLHVVESQSVHAMLAQLVEARTPLHLWIASRSDPPFPLARWRARGYLVEVRQYDLRFSTDESATFLNHGMGLGLSEAQVEILAARTEGWAAGLQLAALSLRNSSDPQAMLSAFGGTHRHIVDYMVGEVLQGLSPELQNFLFQTSILNRLCAPLCEAVVDQEGAQETLELLERDNLFLIPLDEERRWYRYHALFADLLKARLARLMPHHLPELHRRAANWLEQNGLHQDAIEHAIQSGDVRLAAVLVESAARELNQNGESFTLLGWTGRLPAEVITEYPRLLLEQAWALLTTGQLSAIPGLLERLDRQAQHEEISGEADAILSLSASIQGNMPEALAHGQSALEHLPAGVGIARAAVCYALGNAYLYGGNIKAARPLLEDAVRFSRLGDFQTLWIASLQAFGQLVESTGGLEEAAGCYSQIIDLRHDKRFQQLPLVGLGYIGMGGVLAEWGRYEEAEQMLQTSLELSREWRSAEILMGSLSSLINLEISRGRIAEALNWVDAAETELRHRSQTYGLAQLKAVRAGLDLRRGRLEAATRWAVEYEGCEAEPLSIASESILRTLAGVFQARGQSERAGVLLERLSEFAVQGGLTSIFIQTRLQQAGAAWQRGNSTQAMVFLEDALRSGEDAGYFAAFITDSFSLLPLLQTFRKTHPHDRLATKLEAELLRRAALSVELELLSERELEVLRLISAGLSNQQIADRLVIALTTVKTHVKNLLSKLGATNRTEAAARARDRGLI